mmetsp:Transcript_84354/g.149124  ORF Transcript_84354/g.149124 Transcript_84354/m.149124 type:complete len:308 (-) Transcript_84354:70-993(-)
MEEDVKKRKAVLWSEIGARSGRSEDEVSVRHSSLIPLPALCSFAQDALQLITCGVEQTCAELGHMRQRVLNLLEDGQRVQLAGVGYHIYRIEALLAMLCVLPRKLWLCRCAMKAVDHIPGEWDHVRFLHLHVVPDHASLGLVWSPVLNSKVFFEGLVLHDSAGCPMCAHLIPISRSEQARCVCDEHRLFEVDFLVICEQLTQLSGSHLFHRDLLGIELGHRLHAIFCWRKILGDFSRFLLFHHLCSIKNFLHLIDRVLEESQDVLLILLLLGIAQQCHDLLTGLHLIIRLLNGQRGRKLQRLLTMHS